MKLILSFLLSSICFFVSAQTINTFSTIDTSMTDIVKPNSGANEWSYDKNEINIPVQGTNTQRLDRYWRFTWLDFQPANGSQNVFDFTQFDSKIQQSITKGQGFSFGIMQQCSGCDPNVRNDIGGKNLLPTWLINQMPNSYVVNGIRYPDYNSTAYISAHKRLDSAVNAHIMAGSFNGVRYQDVITEVDIRGYGDYGEWTNTDFSQITPTVASLDSLISHTVHIFDKFQCVVMIGAFDGGQLSNVNVPPAVGYYALTVRNSHGVLGWRRDNWGRTDSYITQFLENNPTIFNGLHFKDTIMVRWKQAPITGEPQDQDGTQPRFTDFPRQILLYHDNSFGNGNFNDLSNITNATTQQMFRRASAYAGHRIVVTRCSTTTAPTSGGAFNITLNWRNLGVAPSYQTYNTRYLLKTLAGVTVLTMNSNFNTTMFLPAGADSVVNENFNLSGVAAGTYNLFVILPDPLGFRKPLPLSQTNQQADGSYLLRGNIVVSGGGGVHQPPVAVITGSTGITLPTNSVLLNGTGSHATTGVLVSYLWALVSGPNVPTNSTPTATTTTFGNLIAGSYQFSLKVTDDSAATNTTNWTVIVNPIPNQATTIFTTQTPAGVVENDGTGAIETGVKFQSGLAGFITGIRYYKVLNNLGTHIGELYSRTGTRLAQATFTGETASGWQEVTFASPVSILANTTYIAAVFSSSGNYISTQTGLQSAIANSPLTALADGTDGINGLYIYTATPAVPVNGFNSSNYWIDARFSQSVPGTPVCVDCLPHRLFGPKRN